MIFQNPIAWLGLIAIALPVLAHLLARRPARREPFPTIRFLPAATLKPVRRGRPSDWALLMVRIGIVTAAVVALTQPLWLSATRARSINKQIARAIIVDTGRSMERQTAGGERGAEVARREAQRIASEATHARIEETASPSALMAGSLNWLSGQPMRREVVVVSDFQPSAITTADLDRIPADVGRRLVQVPVTGDVSSAPTGDGRLRLLTSEADERDAEGARAAALATGAPAAIRRDWPAAVMFPSFADREAWLRSAKAPTQTWMFAVAVRVTEDALVKAALERNEQNAAQVIQVLSGPVDGRESLVIVLNQKPHTVLAAATIGALLRAAADVPSPAELDATVRPAAELRALEREPAPTAGSGRPATGNDSDGRWFWAAALLLLVVETVLRRSRRQARAEVQHARVA